MSKKNGNEISNRHQSNEAFSPPSQNAALVKRRFPELFSNVLDAKLALMVSEEKAKWEAEWRKRCKEEHINEIKHTGDFWKL